MLATQKKARRIRHWAEFSGLGGWPKARAVTVRTGEIDVSQCRQQEIATRFCRGRFINATLRWGLATADIASGFALRQVKSRHGGWRFQLGKIDLNRI